MKALALLACSALLAGCGVGIGIGVDLNDDDPPSVSLAADVSRAAPGGPVRLSASASDDDYVVEVDFYRVDANGRATLLCADRSPNYDCNTAVPAGTAVGSLVNFYAVAVDGAGQTANSATVTVTVSGS